MRKNITMALNILDVVISAAILYILYVDHIAGMKTISTQKIVLEIPTETEGRKCDLKTPL